MKLQVMSRPLSPGEWYGPPEYHSFPPSHGPSKFYLRRSDVGPWQGHSFVPQGRTLIPPPSCTRGSSRRLVQKHLQLLTVTAAGGRIMTQTYHDSLSFCCTRLPSFNLTVMVYSMGARPRAGVEEGIMLSLGNLVPLPG